MMDKMLLFVMVVVTFGFILYAINPILSVITLAGFSIGLFLWIYRSGAYTFAKPLPFDESLCLYITKSGQILVDRMERTGEGYLSFKDSFGLLKITENSDYHMFNKPVHIGVEGVSHTVLPKYGKLTQDLAKRDFEDYRDAKQKLETR